ncbi:MAG: AmmeMemoRadiSam system protein A [Acidimicrobiia bacterium]|nr:AmmeMemoRadiSam system protein A [Acidimicrobiia bacterium]
MLIDEDDQQRLLRLAREALEARVHRRAAPAVSRGGALDWPRGAFVTIHAYGDLRGCLGQIDPGAPLAETVAHLAAVVSDSDPRFDPVTPSELSAIEIEISVLTPEREVARPEEVEVGRHGVIIEQGGRRGLLLPQVATEQRWDRETLLSHACLKARLVPDAWRRGARILVFEAQVFGET